MGQVCTKPDEDDNLELIHDRSVQVVEVPIKRRIRPLNTDSLEALQCDTNPFKDDLHRPLANEPGQARMLPRSLPLEVPRPPAMSF
mmetsp:Transcript_28994/g.68491  ORF Transcript_28994/g.68491 Transcript_28994/m.68491 type:complete len:86 (+) Transcript_28994:46-303(+)